MPFLLLDPGGDLVTRHLKTLKRDEIYHNDDDDNNNNNNNHNSNNCQGSSYSFLAFCLEARWGCYCLAYNVVDQNENLFNLKFIVSYNISITLSN